MRTRLSPGYSRMATLLYPRRSAPAIYRLSRFLRRLSLVVLVLTIVFLATVAYSAVRLVQSSPQTGGYSASFASNGTVGVTGSVELSNQGFYPVSGFTLGLRVLNSSGWFLGELHAGPVTLAPGVATTFPIALYLPIAADPPAESLLVTDQYLSVGVWGNTTYAYLFPISVHFSQTKFWGAPFSNLRITTGSPTVENGSVVVPLMLTFTSHATFTELGTLSVQVFAATGLACGGGSFSLAVPPGEPFDQTQNIALSSGCSVAGGHAEAAFISGGTTIPLPPEALP
jgi:hypothetical protein